MGKDIKVGLVIGIIVLLFLFGYWFNRSSSHRTLEEEASPGRASEEDTSILTFAKKEGVKKLTEPEPLSEIEEQGPIVGVPSAEATRPTWPTAEAEPKIIDLERARQLEIEPVIQEVSPSVPFPKEEVVRKYTVKKGDTLITISRKVYGDGSKWRLIRDANNIEDPTRLPIGQVLIILPLPAPSELTSPEGPSLEEAPVLPESRTVKKIWPSDIEERSHKVVKGDTLYAIARKYYKDGSRWRTIAAANGIKDCGKLKVGQDLRIPQ